MLKFEYNMLVLNSSFSDQDVQEINAFADYVREQERERIVELIDLSQVGKYPDAEYIIALIRGK